MQVFMIDSLGASQFYTEITTAKLFWNGNIFGVFTLYSKVTTKLSVFHVEEELEKGVFFSMVVVLTVFPNAAQSSP